MSWVRIDDRAPRHPKHLQAGPMACWLWVCGLTYCSEHLTDGNIPSSALVTFNIPRPEREAERLVSVGLWEVTETGYRIHDYGEYQPSKAQVHERRKRTANRVAEWKERKGHIAGSSMGHGVSNAVSNTVTNTAPIPIPDPIPIPKEPTDGTRTREGDGERLWETFRARAFALRDATLPLTCRTVEFGSVVDFLARYPDPGKRAWLIDAYLTSRHRPIVSSPLSIGQLCKWAPWLEAQATAPTPEPPRTRPAPMPTYGGDWCHHDPRCSCPDVHALMLARERGVDAADLAEATA